MYYFSYIYINNYIFNLSHEGKNKVNITLRIKYFYFEIKNKSKCRHRYFITKLFDTL